MKTQAAWLGLAAALALTACTDEPSANAPSSEEDGQGELGSLSLNLTAADSNGRAYRLRQSEFQILSNEYVAQDSGAGFSKLVSSETNLDAMDIVERVVPGYYSVTLLSDNWYLERFEGSNWVPVEQAVLLSARTQYAYVYNQGISPVAFRFGVDGELIDFRSGELQIGIEIEQPGEGPGNCPWWPPLMGFPCMQPDAGTIVDSGVPSQDDAGVTEDAAISTDAG